MAVGFSRDQWYNYIADRSHPPVASAVVEKPEYDPDHVYAWKPANNYKGWKLIAREETGVDDAEVIQKVLEYTSQLGLDYAIVKLIGTFDIKETIQYYSNVVVTGGTLKTYDGIYAFGNKDPNLSELKNFFLYKVKFVCADGKSGDRLLTTAGAVAGASFPKISNCGIIECEFWNYTYGEIGWGIAQENKVPEDIYIIGNKIYRIDAGSGDDAIDVAGIRVKVNDNLIVNKVQAAEAMAPVFLWDSEIKNNRIIYDPSIPSNLINLEPWKPWDAFADYCFKNVIIEGNYGKNGSFACGGGNYNKACYNVHWIDNKLVCDDNVNKDCSLGVVYQKYSKHIVVKGNRIYNAQLTFEARYATVEDLVIEGNIVVQTIPSPTGGAYWTCFGLAGISDYTLKHVRVHGNTFVKLYDQGKVVNLYYISAPDAEDIVIKNNQIVNPYNVPHGFEGVEWSVVYFDEVMKNSGTATITSGSTSVTVSHGLVAAPSKVKVTPLDDPGSYWYVPKTSITDTSFDIVLASAPTADVEFYWEAEV